MSTTDILKFLETLYTPLISDVMDSLGLKSGVIDHTIQAILGDPHLKVAGYAFPCRVIPTGEYVEIDTLLEMVDAIPQDSMVVVAADADIDAALWGGLMSTRAKSRGARGAVVNGGVRDIEQIAATGFPVFGSYRCIKDIRRRGYMAAYGCPVTIDNVTISPGDIIVADANGVVCIAQQEIGNIIKILTETYRNESKTMNGLEQGESARALFQKFRTF